MSRFAATLQSILRPTSFPGDVLGLESALDDWKLLVAQWDGDDGGRVPSDAVKRHILQEQAPSEIKLQSTCEARC